LKVTIFRGGLLDPSSPETSKYLEVRYLHDREDGPFDAAQFADWVTQASRLPGARM
jgi:hypothetical protein